MDQNIATLTPTQAARMLGLSPQRIIQLFDAGKLSGRRGPLGREVDRADAERLRDERAERRRA